MARHSGGHGRTTHGPAHRAPEAPRSRSSARWATTVVTIIALVLAAMVVGPFASALLLAAVLAGAVHPLHRWLRRHLGGRAVIAAALVTLAITLLVLVPLAGMTVTIARQAADGVAWLNHTLREEGATGLVTHLPQALQPWARRALDQLPEDPQQLQDLFAGQQGRAAAVVGGAVSATWGLLFQAAMMLIAFYFLLLDGPTLVDWLVAVSPLRPHQTRQLLADFRNVSVSVLVSSLLTAAIQAVVALAGYAMAGLPHALFFAVVTFVIGLIPAVGAGGVGLAAAGIQLLRGHGQSALFLAIWAVAVVGLVDNLVKPYLIRGRMQLHGAVVFFALVGGIAAFGAIGLIAGPLIVSFLLAVLRMDREPVPDEPSAAEAAEGSAGT